MFYGIVATFCMISFMLFCTLMPIWADGMEENGCDLPSDREHSESGSCGAD